MLNMNKINLLKIIIEYFLVKVNIIIENFQLGGVKVIYNKIQKLCAQKGISIYRLEKDLGFSSASICKWKSSIPSVDNLLKVSKYFGVPLEELLEDEEG